MKTLFKLVILSLILCVGTFLTSCDSSSTTPSGPDGSNLVLVANQYANTLSIVNIDDGYALNNKIGVGNNPNDLIYYDSKIYVINSVSNDMNILRLTDDNEFATVHAPLDLGVNRGNSPQYGTIGGGFMFITNFNTDDVNVIELDSLFSTAYIPVGTAPQDILTVGDKIYVACCGYNINTYTYGEGSISVLSVETKTRLRSIIIGNGKNPQYLALDSDNRVHVVCSGNWDDIVGEIFVIDTELDEVVQVISMRGTPGEIAITSTDQAYVVAGGWEEGPGLVYRYNAHTGQILNGPENPIEVSAGATRVVVDADDNVYVACQAADKVDKIVNGVKVGSYEVGDAPAPMVFMSR
ncbi:hypothetical protein K9N50_12185 [bacterium]|nr:hypothetical protein [bacterium]